MALSFLDDHCSGRLPGLNSTFLPCSRPCNSIPHDCSNAQTVSMCFRKGMGLMFKDQLGVLIQGMAKSKSLCKHMFDAPYSPSVLDDPQSNVERIESVPRLNGQKAQAMKCGGGVIAVEIRRSRTRKLEKSALKSPRHLHKHWSTAPLQASLLPPRQCAFIWTRIDKNHENNSSAAQRRYSHARKWHNNTNLKDDSNSSHLANTYSQLIHHYQRSFCSSSPSQRRHHFALI